MKIQIHPHLPRPLLVPLSIITLALAGCGKSDKDYPPLPPVNATAPVAQTLSVIGHAPAWEFTNLDDRPVTSKKYKGKVVILDFWSSASLVSREDFLRYAAWQEKYRARGFEIVAPALDPQGRGGIASFLAGRVFSFAVIIGTPEGAKAYGVESAPAAFLIDRKGQVRHVKTASFDAEKYEQFIVQLLDEPAQ